MLQVAAQGALRCGIPEMDLTIRSNLEIVGFGSVFWALRRILGRGPGLTLNASRFAAGALDDLENQRWESFGVSLCLGSAWPPLSARPLAGVASVDDGSFESDPLGQIK